MTIASNPPAISSKALKKYVEAYRLSGSLTQGFDFYRAFKRDAETNASGHSSIATPLLYLRGAAEGGNIEDYARGFTAAGVEDVSTAIIPEAEHFVPEEAPAAFWNALLGFASPTTVR